MDPVIGPGCAWFTLCNIKWLGQGKPGFVRLCQRLPANWSTMRSRPDAAGERAPCCRRKFRNEAANKRSPGRCPPRLPATRSCNSCPFNGTEEVVAALLAYYARSRSQDADDHRKWKKLCCLTRSWRAAEQRGVSINRGAFREPLPATRALATNLFERPSFVIAYQLGQRRFVQFGEHITQLCTVGTARRKTEAIGFPKGSH